MAIGINSSCAQYTAPPRAPDEVSISWKAGQTRSIRLTTPSPAVAGSVLATFLISATASFKRWQARWEPLHPNARARSRDLNAHVCFAVIYRRYFGIRRMAAGEWRGDFRPDENANGNSRNTASVRKGYRKV